MDHSISSFLSGYAAVVAEGTPRLLFAAKQVDQYAEQDQPNSSFFIFREGQWAKFATNVGWPAIAIASVKPADGARVVVSVSPHDDYYEIAPATLTETTGKIAVKESLSLRALATIEDTI